MIGLAPQGGGPIAGAIAAIDRLAETIAEETRSLRETNAPDLDRFTHQKNHGLLEVTRAMRAVPASAPHPVLTQRLYGLRTALDENLALLGAHLAAAREIADIVSNAVEEAESDGTYSDCAPRGARR